MFESLEGKSPRKIFLTFLFSLSAFWFGVYLVSFLSFFFFNWLYREVLFLRGGCLKLEVKVLKLLLYLTPANERLRWAAYRLSPVHVCKWWNQKAKRSVHTAIPSDLWSMIDVFIPTLPCSKKSLRQHALRHSGWSSYWQRRGPKVLYIFVCFDSCIMLFHSQINQLNVLLSGAILCLLKIL